MNSGPLGQKRGIGFGILMIIVTLGFYGWYWAFKTHEELKQRTGEGLGGVLGLVIWILITPVNAFVIPSEIGKMYARRREAVAGERHDGTLALPVRDLHHPGDRLVREGAGLPQHVLGRAPRRRQPHRPRRHPPSRSHLRVRAGGDAGPDRAPNGRQA